MRSKNPMLFAKVAIGMTAAIWIGFALWLGINPQALLIAFGVEQSTPPMLTEIRAFYGGVELAIAACMLLLMRSGLYRPALLIGGLPLLGSSAFRCIGSFVDGFSGLHLAMAGIEFGGFLFCLAAYSQLDQQPT